jgi:hypothetical protein
MKKTIKPTAARAPVKKVPAKKSSAKATPRVARGQPEIMAILERLAKNTERLARAAERLEAARPLAAKQSEQPPLLPDAAPETPGEEVVGVVVIDENDEE